MKYFLDCEFNSFNGELISIGLVREDNEALYLVYELPKKIDPWVKKNVVPILWSIPSPIPGMAYGPVTQEAGARHLANYFNRGGDVPYIITDWPDDISYLCKALITVPGQMATVARLQFDMVRVDSYPTDVKGAVQHNSYWDAMALKRKLGF